MRKKKIFKILFVVVTIFLIPYFSNTIIDAEASIITMNFSWEEELKEDIITALENYQTKIDISEYKIPYINRRAVIDLYSNVLEENGRYFYVYDRPSYSYDYNLRTLEFVYLPEFKDDSGLIKIDFIKEISALVNSFIEQGMSYIDSSMSDEEKLLAIHDYLIREVDYDYENYQNNTIPYESYSITGVVKNQLVVCEGYSRTFQILSRSVGIPCIIVSSDAMNHAWNMVNLNGYWYHIDTTWDDIDSGSTLYRHFLCSDDEIEEEGHYDWVHSSQIIIDNSDIKTAPAAMSDAYQDYFFANIDYYGISGSSSYNNGYWYYTYGENTIYKVRFDGSNQSVYSISDKIERMYSLNGFLYYSTMNSIVKINFDGTSPVIVAGTKNEDGIAIQDFIIRQGRMLYKQLSLFHDDLLWYVKTGKQTAEVIGVYNKTDFALFIDEIIIPPTVSVAGITYKVVGIADRAFSEDCGTNYSSLSHSVYVDRMILSEGIEYIGQYIGSKGSGIQNITLPSTLKSIGKGAFSYLGISEIVIPQGIEYIGPYAFHSCYNLTTVKLPEGITEIPSGMFAFCENLTEITIPNSVKHIRDQAFWYSGIQNIILTNKLETLGNHVFANCAQLQEITLPGSITNFGLSTFSASGLRKITLSYGIVEIPEGFLVQTSVEEVILPETITKIGSQAFAGLDSLTKVILPTSLLEIGDNAFASCRNLSELRTMDSKKPFYLPENLIYIGEGAFMYCTSLSGEVTVPNSITSIEDYTFTGCSGLTGITISNNVQSIGEMVFYNCYNLKKLSTDGGANPFTLPTNLNTIGEGAFENCNGLIGKLFIPEQVNTIPSYMLSGCSSLSEIIFPNEISSMGFDVFYGCDSVEKVWFNQLSNITFQYNVFEELPNIVVLGWDNSYIQRFSKNNSVSFEIITEFPSQEIVQPSNDFTYLIFEPEYYLQNNTDLIGQGMDNMGLYKHWIDFGIAEGRVGSRIFNIVSYLQMNNDVAYIYGTDHKGAFEHYINYGCDEFRPASTEYNGFYYKSNYGDLANLNNKELINHYLLYGRIEGRVTSHLLSSEGDNDDYDLSEYTAIFDLNFYKTSYPDVVDAVGEDEASLLKHFIEYGIVEGRQGCATFDVMVYRDYNLDLVEAFGNDLTKYYLHYNNYGINEGRVASITIPDDGGYNSNDYIAIYDESYYIATNPEIASSFGNNSDMILKHFIEYGMSEGRQASSGFNVWVYREYNPDLVAAFESNLSQYYLHYNSYGIYEGRIATINTTIPNYYDPSDYDAIFDYYFYTAYNPDVIYAIGSESEKVLEHFVDYGMAEGRQGSVNFNVWIYQSYNPDLNALFGNDLKKYYEHFQMYGQYEGRVSSSV